MPKPKRAPSPAWELSRLMEAWSMTQKELARRLGVSPTTVGRIVRGARRIDAELSVALARVFDTNPGYWLRLQTDYELADERAKQAANGLSLAPKESGWLSRWGK